MSPPEPESGRDHETAQPTNHQPILLHHHSQYLDTSVHKQEQHIFTGGKKPMRFIQVMTNRTVSFSKVVLSQEAVN